MIKVNRRSLEIASKYIDVRNPKFELNYLYVDNKNIVSTNTRALVIVKHHGNIEKDEDDFFIHKNIVDVALKQRKAKKFILQSNGIILLDDKGNELFTISAQMYAGNYQNCVKYPEYKNIIPKDMKKNIPFVNSSQINGILAVNKIIVDEKYIPNLKGSNEFESMQIGINSIASPISIKSGDITIVIMPIIDRFEQFNGEEYDALKEVD